MYCPQITQFIKKQWKKTVFSDIMQVTMSKILQNNVVLIASPCASTAAVTVGFYFITGSRLEKKGEYGITHFVEHLLFKGTKNRSPREILSAFDRMGGYCNAFTEMEDVCLYCTVPAEEEKVKSAFDILCDMSSNCIFDSGELEKERLVVENEIIMGQDDPEDSGLEALVSKIWPDSGLGRAIAGSVADVENLKREQIIRWYENYFVKGELVVVVSAPESFFGEKEFNVCDFAEKKLMELGEHRKVRRYPEELHFKNECDFVPGFYNLKSNFQQCQIYYAFPYAGKISERDYYVASVFNTIMGDSMTSRLFDSLRERLGLCYSVYSFFSIYEDTCMWYACAGCSSENVNKTLEALREEVLGFFGKELSDSEVLNAKEHLLGEEKINSCDTEFIMKNLQRNYSLGFSPYTTEHSLDCIRSVQKDDIIDFVKRFLVNTNAACVVYGKGLKKTKKIKEVYNEL